MGLSLLEASITGGVGSVVNIFTENVVPLLSTSPMNIFIGVALFGAGCAVFRHARRTAH